MSQLIKEILSSESHFAINKKAIKMFGLEEAAILSLLCDYESTSKFRDEYGWFPVNASCIQDTLNIGRRPYDSAIAKLCNEGIIKTKLAGQPATKHFKLMYDEIQSRLFGKDNQVCTERTSKFEQNEHSSLFKTDNPVCTERTTLNNIYIKEDNIKEDSVKYEESLSKDKSSSTKKKSVKEKVELDYTFIEEPWKDAFRQWYNYKKERGELYKTQRTLEAAYALLKKYALNDPANAIQVVLQSIGNEHQGLYPLKQINNGTATRYNQQQFGTQNASETYGDARRRALELLDQRSKGAVIR